MLGNVAGVFIEDLLSAHIGDENIHFVGKLIVFVVVFREGLFDFFVGDFFIVDMFVFEDVVDLFVEDTEREVGGGRGDGIFGIAIMSGGNGTITLDKHAFDFGPGFVFEEKVLNVRESSLYILYGGGVGDFLYSVIDFV